MLRRRRKTDFEPETALLESDRLIENKQLNCFSLASIKNAWRDYFKFAIYCALLAVPLYAITKSILKHDWVMVIIDALIVPVGFVHGLLLLFGYVS